jgi:transcriptional regulator with XRE-family HTH domain
MTYAVNLKELQNWMQQHEPMAIEKLAAASRVSTKTLGKVLNGKAPGHASTRWSVAQAMGVAEDVLFPPRKTSKAS